MHHTVNELLKLEARLTAEIYSHMIHGQDDEAARRWDEFQRQNLPAKQVGGVQ